MRAVFSPGRHRGVLAGVMVAVVVSAAMLVTSVPAQAATVFGDDFEDGNADGWTRSGGSWSVVTDSSWVFR